ncbi:MAG TPA: DNA repair protein RadC [Candidatus Marinimicrobia bacterium]|jgi:DNA repair protein RadC|nr:DNA repair protein RadC [Candidatus Neomarinimicrobiota bacterium]MDP7121893.1 DNA repair protein RadC [Candidatus Neomarinimicrobiota bacterium]MDP7484142.1 DNA repair protein RadC [Candidatus Neomarinimicrobiota bacterium]MDP7715360.1 DNA repair protein RadC [Candidatus Neomarinimicrobiota bacterium]HJL84209.1 DNA repair protein RadC [Candidatus Neomarinimicrobiota bacterium]|tara:strand:- start:4233 stop:4907 length:675 start_codon:yes stop_codon:yes gene_type:complete
MATQNEGHRQRLRNKFLKSGLEGFHDYEIIELLLTLGTPRKDCKQPARNALKKFGSLRGVLEADSQDLKGIKGIGDNNVFGLKIAQAVARRYLADRVIDQDFIRSSDEVLEYLRHNLRDKEREVFMVIYLNGRNQIMGMEELFEGTLTTSAVYPREVVKRAIDHKAAALVFVHNHPSGNADPSQGDLTITKKLKEATAVIDVSVHDHLIIAGNDIYSFADHGLI